MDTRETYPEKDPTDLLAREGVAAWEEIAAGRFMPRRTRGSCRGRVLG
jgi:hypothetical protein